MYESFLTGDHEFSFVSFPLICQRIGYAYSDLVSDTLTIPVESGFVVLGVAHEVVTAFSGGTPALNIGDGTDADEWIAAASLALGTVGDFFVSWAGATDAIGGKKFNSVGQVKLTHATGLTQGEGYVYLLMLDLRENWRTSGEIGAL